MAFNCQICKEDYSSVDTFGSHLKKRHKMILKDYYTKFSTKSTSGKNESESSEDSSGDDEIKTPAVVSNKKPLIKSKSERPSPPPPKKSSGKNESESSDDSSGDGDVKTPEIVSNKKTIKNKSERPSLPPPKKSPGKNESESSDDSSGDDDEIRAPAVVSNKKPLIKSKTERPSSPPSKKRKKEPPKEKRNEPKKIEEKSKSKEAESLVGGSFWKKSSQQLISKFLSPKPSKSNEEVKKSEPAPKETQLDEDDEEKDSFLSTILLEDEKDVKEEKTIIRCELCAIEFIYKEAFKVHLKKTHDISVQKYYSMYPDIDHSLSDLTTEDEESGESNETSPAGAGSGDGLVLNGNENEIKEELENRDKKQGVSVNSELDNPKQKRGEEKEEEENEEAKIDLNKVKIEKVEIKVPSPEEEKEANNFLITELKDLKYLSAHANVDRLLRDLPTHIAEKLNLEFYLMVYTEHQKFLASSIDK